MEKNKKLTGQPNVLKQVNTGLIKDAFHKLGTATRIEISEVTKLSQPTVNAIITQMLGENVVIEKGLAVSSGGRPAMKYALNSEAVFVAALIAYTDALVYEVRDISGKIIERGRNPVNHAKTYFDNILILINKLLENNDRIKSVALGVPGAVSNNGKIFAVPQIKELEDCDLKADLSKRVPAVVDVVNDINTTALGYFHLDSQQKIGDMVYLHIGGGLGAGVIIGKRIINGFSSFAGELGYMQVDEGQDIEEILLSSKDEKEIERIISRIVTNIICVVNPPVMVLGGTVINQNLVEKVRTNCLSRMPAGMIPFFTWIKDEQKYYFEGLIQTAINSISGEIRLVLD